MAGLVSPSLGWKAPYAIVAIPNLVLAIVIFFTTSEPRRGMAEQKLSTVDSAVINKNNVEYKGQITWTSFKGIFKIRSNIYSFLQGIHAS